MDLAARKFIPWEQSVPDYKYIPEEPFFQILVPTIDTVRYSYIIKTLVQVLGPRPSPSRQFSALLHLQGPCQRPFPVPKAYPCTPMPQACPCLRRTCAQGHPLPLP